MSLETQAQRFIDTLNALGGSAGNGRLSTALGWADDTYERVKGQLIEAGQIVPGRGRGGSVALAGTSSVSAAAIPTKRAQAAAPAAKANGRKAEANAYTQAFNAIDKAMRNDEGCAMTRVWPPSWTTPSRPRGCCS